MIKRVSSWMVHFLMISLILIILALPTFLLCNGSVEALDLPTRIHLTWQHSDMSRTITVTWQTRYAESGNTVVYDDVSRNGSASLYRYSAVGTAHTYLGASGYIHDVELTDLKPNSTYYFVCGGQNGGYSNERSFRTAPVPSSHLRFVVGGDCRTDWLKRDEVSRAMSKFNPNFVLLGGDLVTDGHNQTQWDSFFDSLDSYWIGNDNLTIPIIPCLGNHEKNATNYYEQFALPGNEQWYSFNWGKYVHITVLNSEANPTGDQLEWLENDLASHENYTWKFVLFHQPLFSSGQHGSWNEGREHWSPLFDKYRVDIVFSGHDHDYERSKAINYTASKTSPQSSYSMGTMYIVSGGWGAPLYPAGSTWWTEYSSSEYHFVLVDIFINRTLNLQTKDILGLTFDEVLQKSPIMRARVRIGPTPTPIDRTPPTISIGSPQNKTYASTSVPLIFTVSEKTSWISYGLDGQATMTITENTNLTGLSEGIHSLVVYAKDMAGNIGSSPRVYFTVDTVLPDTTPPTISILSPENKTYDTPDTQLTFTVDESVPWMAYSLDEQANVTITEDITLYGLTKGTHSLILYVRDTAGNTGTSEKIYFTVEPKQAGPTQPWIVAVITVIAGVAFAFMGHIIYTLFKMSRPLNREGKIRFKSLCFNP